MLTLSKTEQICFLIQFQLIWQLTVTCVPRTVSTSSDGNPSVIQRCFCTVIGFISLNVHRSTLIFRLTCNTVSIVCINVHNWKLTEIERISDCILRA